MQKNQSGNILFGKKRAVCGDSFTAGVTGNTFTEGRFAGKNIAYPYFIAERNSMEIAEFFMGGVPSDIRRLVIFITALPIPMRTAITAIFRKMPIISRSILASMIPIMNMERPRMAKIQPASFPLVKWTTPRQQRTAVRGTKCFPG